MSPVEACRSQSLALDGSCYIQHRPSYCSSLPVQSAVYSYPGLTADRCSLIPANTLNQCFQSLSIQEKLYSDCVELLNLYCLILKCVVETYLFRLCSKSCTDVKPQSLTKYFIYWFLHTVVLCTYPLVYPTNIKTCSLVCTLLLSRATELAGHMTFNCCDVAYCKSSPGAGLSEHMSVIRTTKSSLFI